MAIVWQLWDLCGNYGVYVTVRGLLSGVCGDLPVRATMTP